MIVVVMIIIVASPMSMLIGILLLPMMVVMMMTIPMIEIIRHHGHLTLQLGIVWIPIHFVIITFRGRLQCRMCMEANK